MEIVYAALIAGVLFLVFYALKKKRQIKALVKLPFFQISFEANNTDSSASVNKPKDVSTTTPSQLTG